MRFRCKTLGCQRCYVFKDVLFNTAKASLETNRTPKVLKFRNIDITNDHVPDVRRQVGPKKMPLMHHLWRDLYFRRGAARRYEN